jgi:succinyl-diaminopimelate desuccinylase
MIWSQNMNRTLDSIVKSYSERLVDCVCESIRIPSVYSCGDTEHPYGNGIEEAAKHARLHARKLGFRTAKIGGHVSWAEFGDSDETIAVMGHLDVVQPGNGWDFDPYSGEVKNGYILGRGSQDDKGPLFASLFALRTVADLDVPLKRKVRIIFGTDEETGKMRDVEAYLCHEEVPIMAFTPDGEFPIVNTEKGVLKFKAYKEFQKNFPSEIHLLEIHGGESLGSVPAHASATLIGDSAQISIACEKIKNMASARSWNVTCEIGAETMSISVSGKAAHATLPELGQNAIGQLLILLSVTEISGEEGEYIRFLANSIGTDTSGTILNISTSHPHSGSLTLNLALVSGGTNGITIQVGVYVPANTLPFDAVRNTLKEAFSSHSASIEIIAEAPPLFFPEDHILIKKLKAGYFNATGEDPKLISMCGGTYSKKMPNMVPFGAAFSEDEDRSHAANERIMISNLIKGARIMAYAILEMAT